MNEQCPDAYFVSRSLYADQGIPQERTAETSLLRR